MKVPLRQIRSVAVDPATADPGSLPIAETFYSIQGEGKLTGTPSFFVRVSGCNLRCAWCDTPYTSWAPEGQKRGIAEIVAEIKASAARYVVLTGGEPMMFPQAAELVKLVRGMGLHVTIETSGSIDNGASCDLLSVSPKLASSAPQPGDPRDPEGIWRERHNQRRLNWKALQGMWDRHRARQIKFVVTGEHDLLEVLDILERLANWRKDDVLLMPEGVTPPSAELKAFVVRTCLERGWRYCPRLHIDLFGHTRGT